jgi:hypothetical protein
MKSFVHGAEVGMSTMSELIRLYSSLSPSEFLGCYAYARQSGFRAFELSIGDDFWASTASRWLFGIDYGRTDPKALREIAKRENTDIRIFDGAWVVEQDGFWPRRDFHAKVAVMENAEAATSGMVLGSGNFSYNGLKRSVEAGATFISASGEGIAEQVAFAKRAFDDLWESSTPLADVLERYELRRSQHESDADARKPKKPAGKVRAFWIEAGYVTKNRNENVPGNQIFFPRGFSEFFGFKLKKNEKKNAVIGRITFRTAVGDPVTNNLRLNGNSMEKISLPIPETHGFGVYDGKVLVFERAGSAFRMTAFEEMDFEAIYGHRLTGVQRMKGGRRYGAIS